jgi:hypothetical protein
LEDAISAICSDSGFSATATATDATAVLTAVSAIASAAVCMVKTFSFYAAKMSSAAADKTSEKKKSGKLYAYRF